MEKTRTFAKNSLIYFLGKALTLLVTIFLLPLYTSKISTDNYGYYELVRSILNVLLPFVCMEMWSGVFRLFYWKKSEDYPKQLFASSFYYCCVCALLIGLGFAIAGLIGSTKDWFFSILLVFSEMISFLFTYYARSLKKNLAFSLSGIFASLANATVGIISVTLFSLQEEAMFLALICGFLVQDIILFFWLKLWRYLSIKNFSFSVLKDIIKFSWPFGISTLLYYLSNGFVSLLIGLYISTSAVAIYSVAMKFMSVIVLAAGIFSMSWTDIIYAVDDEQQRRSLIEHWADRFCRFFCILSICSMAFIQ